MRGVGGRGLVASGLLDVALLTAFASRPLGPRTRPPSALASAAGCWALVLLSPTLASHGLLEHSQNGGSYCHLCAALSFLLGVLVKTLPRWWHHSPSVMCPLTACTSIGSSLPGPLPHSFVRSFLPASPPRRPLSQLPCLWWPGGERSSSWSLAQGDHCMALTTPSLFGPVSMCTHGRRLLNIVGSGSG